MLHIFIKSSCPVLFTRVMFCHGISKLAIFFFPWDNQDRLLPSRSIKLKVKLTKSFLYVQHDRVTSQNSPCYWQSRWDLSFNARDTPNSNIHYRGITLERTPRFIVIGLGFMGRRATKEGTGRAWKRKRVISQKGGKKYRGSGIALICHGEIL